jgi:hypothetical protein
MELSKLWLTYLNTVYFGYGLKFSAWLMSPRIGDTIVRYVGVATRLMVKLRLLQVIL